MMGCGSQRMKIMGCECGMRVTERWIMGCECGMCLRVKTESEGRD